MKATWNTPLLKVTLFLKVSLTPPRMFMQWLLCSPVCSRFSLDALLSKPSLSLTTCPGAYFSHYTTKPYKLPLCSLYATTRNSSGPAQLIHTKLPHPPFFPPLNSSSVHSRNDSFKFLFLQMHSTSISLH